MKKTQASSTAILIAASLSFLSRQRVVGALVPVEARTLGDWLMASYSGVTRGTLSSLDRRWFRSLIRGLESLTIPHMVEHYAQRKLAIESLIREGRDFTQLIVLGAGFDTLALRLVADLPDLNAWEVDHPATQAWKTKAVVACGLGSPRLAFLPRDLSLSGPLDLLIPTYRQEGRTIWVAEGFLMYFPAARVEEFFRFIRESSGPGSRVIFTFMEPQADGRVDFRRPSRGVRLWLAQRREPFAWGIRRVELAAFLDGLGFTLLDLPSPINREMDRLNVGEYLAHAEVR